MKFFIRLAAVLFLPAILFGCGKIAPTKTNSMNKPRIYLKEWTPCSVELTKEDIEDINNLSLNACN